LGVRPRGVAYPGAQDDEQLAHAGDDGDLSGCEQAIVERTNGCIVQSGTHRGHIQHLANITSAATDAAASFTLAAVVVAVPIGTSLCARSSKLSGRNFADATATSASRRTTVRSRASTEKHDVPGKLKAQLELLRAKPKGRRNLGDLDIPEERVEILDPALEGIAERIGFEESYHAGYRRGGPVRIVKARAVYKKPPVDNEAPEIVTAYNPKEIYERAMLAPSLIAHILTKKFASAIRLVRRIGYGFLP
jgi:hypothetical protein